MDKLQVKKENLRNGQFLIYRLRNGVFYTIARCYDEETADALVGALTQGEGGESVVAKGEVRQPDVLPNPSPLNPPRSTHTEKRKGKAKPLHSQKRVAK